jgi:hypothetical protein
MKKNKKFIALIALCVVMLSPLACRKGFLNTTDTFAATEEATFQHSQDVVAIVNSVYDTYQSSDLLKKSIWYSANFLTHDFYNNGSDIVWNYYGIQSDFAALATLWNNAYVGVQRANSALQIITYAEGKGIVTPALGQRLTGECLFLRGTIYYYMTCVFGGVPLVLESNTNGLQPRSTQDQCFQQVVADMQKAESLLPSKTQYAASDLGRATKGAAYGYEGAAQMWLKNYTAALAAFTNTELTTNYSLVTPYINVNEYNNQNNEESLFEVQFQISGSQSWDGGWQDGGEEAWIDDFDWPQEISGFGYDYANPGLEYSYEPGDTRKLATVGGPDDSLISPGIIAKWGGIRGYAVVQAGFAANNPIYIGENGKAINTIGKASAPWYGTDGTPRSGYYCTKKWRDPTLTGANGTSAIFGGQNQVLLRYGEILLDKAECEVHLGQTSAALADIQTVRNRAWGGIAPPMQSIVVTGTYSAGAPNGGGTLVTTPVTDPMQMVLNEYRHELSADYSEFFDFRRAGTGVDAAFIQSIYNTTSNPNQIVYPYGPTADGKTHGVWITSLTTGKDILPIPITEFATNPNLVQNPGY